MKDGQAFIIIAEMKHHPYNLRGSSLEVFSALYSLTKKRAFLGSYADLASWIEIDRVTLTRAIKRLQEKGLVSVEEHSGSRFEFQAHHIKGYPLPDYKYCGKKSTTDAPVIDSQNINEYRTELEAVQNEHLSVQNEHLSVQNERISKEKNQKKNNYNIYTKSSFHTKEEVEGKTATAAPQKSLEEEIVPFPTTLQEVLEYVQEKQPGISFEVARDFFVYYSAKGWRYKSNGIVRNWKAELFLWDQRSKRWEKEKATRTLTRYQQGGYRGRGGDNYACGGTPPSLAQIMAEEAIRRQKEAERKIAEEHDKAANTPEAKAAAERVCAKYGNLHHFTPQC